MQRRRIAQFLARLHAAGGKDRLGGGRPHEALLPDDEIPYLDVSAAPDNGQLVINAVNSHRDQLFPPHSYTMLKAKTA